METLLPELLKAGPLGLVICLLIFMLERARIRIADLEKRETEKERLLIQLFNDRITDMKAYGDVVRGNMTALAALAQEIKADSEQGKAVLECMKQLDAALQSLEATMRDLKQQVAVLEAKRR